MTALYCEIDPFAAAWLRGLIDAGQCAPGVVTETPLQDLYPHDLLQYDQVHLCAGIAVWSYALRRIGWPDHRRIWSSSFPCQPFSAAGKGLGFADERHLWPYGLHLIQQCRPDLIVGEQVASKDGLAWLDVVFADLEASGYAVWAVDLCAAGVGAPHIRQRTWWFARRVADADDAGQYPHVRDRQINSAQDVWGRFISGPLQPMARGDESQSGGMAGARGGQPNGVGISAGRGCERIGGQPKYGEPLQTNQSFGGLADDILQQRSIPARNCDETRGRQQEPTETAGLCGGSRLGHPSGATSQWNPGALSGTETGKHGAGVSINGGQSVGSEHASSSVDAGQPGPVNGFWSDTDWLFCRDNKWRPVEAGSFPLAHGLPRSMAALGPELSGLAVLAGLDGKSLARAKAHRVGTLKGYGNAIVASAAEEFLRAALLDGPVK